MQIVSIGYRVVQNKQMVSITYQFLFSTLNYNPKQKLQEVCNRCLKPKPTKESRSLLRDALETGSQWITRSGQQTRTQSIIKRAENYCFQLSTIKLMDHSLHVSASSEKSDLEFKNNPAYVIILLTSKQHYCPLDCPIQTVKYNRIHIHVKSLSCKINYKFHNYLRSRRKYYEHYSLIQLNIYQIHQL